MVECLYLRLASYTITNEATSLDHSPAHLFLEVDSVFEVIAEERWWCVTAARRLVRKCDTGEETELFA